MRSKGQAQGRPAGSTLRLSASSPRDDNHDGEENASHLALPFSPTLLLRRVGRSSGAKSADLLHLQTPGWQRTKQVGLIAANFEPSRPVRALRYDHLPVMDRRNVRAGLGRQQAKGCASLGHWTPQPGEAEPVLTGHREFPFRVGRLGAGELEEV